METTYEAGTKSLKLTQIRTFYFSVLEIPASKIYCAKLDCYSCL